MSKRVLVPLTAGFEEMKPWSSSTSSGAGVEVLLAGLDGGAGSGSRHHRGWVDLGASMAEFDAVVLPGGLGGTHAMRDDERVRSWCGVASCGTAHRGGLRRAAGPRPGGPRGGPADGSPERGGRLARGAE